MIIKSHGYGILLTDEVGEPLNGLEELLQALLSLPDPGVFMVSCPSPKKRQYLLGFRLKASKYTDFEQADENWYELMASLPKAIKQMADKAGIEEPDIEVMAGQC